MNLEQIQREFTKLQRATRLLLIVGIASLLLVGVFAIHEVRLLRTQQRELEGLTNDLCMTLERAGILIQGTQENPCER